MLRLYLALINRINQCERFWCLYTYDFDSLISSFLYMFLNNCFMAFLNKMPIIKSIRQFYKADIVSVHLIG